jgi:hypothetical protein
LEGWDATARRVATALVTVLNAAHDLQTTGPDRS